MVAEDEAAEPRDHGYRTEDAEHKDGSVALEGLALLATRRKGRPVVADLEYFADSDQDETENNDGDLENEHVLNHPAR